MSDNLEDLALFPLNLVLFPSSLLRLHIFEPRYKLMVEHCLQDDLPFGIVLIRHGTEAGGIAEPYLVGTRAKIVQVFPFDNGTMDIVVQGESRFRIRGLDESRPYLIGHVQDVREYGYEISDLTEGLVEETKTNFMEWCQALFPTEQIAVKVAFPDDWTLMSFQISNWMPVENLQKQQLLEMTDTVDRLQLLNEMLADQVSNLVVSQDRQPLTLEDLRGYIFPN
ncbi:MAG TPA: LON peptidase substrate-binding domain-containing protein [Fimbriimonadaceae bacterium]|nr:LON peptidase substrate-binding domain-containing protein [Fimbriimonadaceae bacterium]